LITRWTLHRGWPVAAFPAREQGLDRFAVSVFSAPSPKFQGWQVFSACHTIQKGLAIGPLIALRVTKQLKGIPETVPWVSCSLKKHRAVLPVPKSEKAGRRVSEDQRRAPG
jgi:hypothetical protein